MNKGKLTFFCGKMGAGKSTMSKQVALETHAVLLSEDEWLESIFPNKITSLEDYIHYANLLKPQIKKLVQSILTIGTDVVMDFPANTLKQRRWFKAIFSEVEAPHQLIYLDIPNAVCLKQIEKRNIEKPERSATDTEYMFEQVTKYFLEPTIEEAFNVVRVTQNT